MLRYILDMFLQWNYEIYYYLYINILFIFRYESKLDRNIQKRKLLYQGVLNIPIKPVYRNTILYKLYLINPACRKNICGNHLYLQYYYNLY